MNRRYTLLVLLVCCLRPSEANASGLVVHSVTDEGTAATISRSVSQTTIDRVLDEPDWKAAAPIGEIRQREPHEGQRSSTASATGVMPSTLPPTRWVRSLTRSSSKTAR